MATDFDAARTALRRKTVAPFRAWRLSRPEAASIREADNDLGNGWVREADREVIELSVPYSWEGKGLPAVTVDEMHTWSMTDSLLLAHSTTGSWSYLEVVVELAEDWSDAGATTRRAWEPQSIAARAHRLAYVVHAAAVADGLDTRRWRTLARLAERHAKRLKEEVRGTDGLLAAIAARSLAVRLGPHLNTLSQSRIQTALDDAVGRDGALASSTTADHVTVVAALAATDIDDPDAALTERRRSIEDGLAWLITTDGQPANFGATALEPVNGLWRGGDVPVKAIIDPFVSEGLRHALSAGSAGQAPTTHTRHLAGAGLFVMKPIWPSSADERGPYVAMHGDGGDFVWHDVGRPLIVAPGTDAAALSGGTNRRIELVRPRLDESPATNVLALDPAMDDCDWTGRVGVVNNATFLDASGQAGTVQRRRTLLAGPGRWLMVADWVADEAGELQNAEQRFLLGPGLDAVEESDHYLVMSDGAPVLWAASLHGSPHRTGPQRSTWDDHVGGWWAPRPGRIAPAMQIGWSAEGSHVLIASLFSLAGPPRAEPAGPWSFAFTIDGWTTRVALNETGLADLQEVAA